jgi:hypothetical protein
MRQNGQPTAISFAPVAIASSTRLRLIRVPSFSSIYILGTPVELYFGRNKHILIMLTSLIFGSLASALFNNPLITRVGVSGMVIGLFGSLALIGAHVGGLLGRTLITLALTRYKYLR